MNSSQSYSDFERKLLKLAYTERGTHSADKLLVRDLVEKNSLIFEGVWVNKAVSRLHDNGFIKGPPTVDGALDQALVLTGDGLAEAERLIELDRPTSFAEKLRSIPRAEWIAFAALVVSAIALLKG
ncbi:MAG: hypothetical protein AAFZ11_05560 [Pseudomonadota bacterium]